jgi:hypothetical protein
MGGHGLVAELGEGEATSASGRLVDAQSNPHSRIDLAKQGAELILRGVVA